MTPGPLNYVGGGLVQPNNLNESDPGSVMCQLQRVTIVAVFSGVTLNIAPPSAEISVLGLWPRPC